jgi:[ribosomal protein S18]-alanine N-acetyltransferase
MHTLKSVYLTSATLEDAILLVELETAASIAPWTLQQFSDCIAEKNPTYLLWQDSVAIGFIIYHLIAGQCEIYNIAVHPDFQGQGWGKYLLKQAMAAAREIRCESIFLEVRASNRPARGMYQALGFNEIGIRKNYYKIANGQYEDAVMMAMDLFYE